MNAETDRLDNFPVARLAAPSVAAPAKGSQRLISIDYYYL